MLSTHILHSPFFYKDWVCRPFWAYDFSNKSNVQELCNFYPNSLLPILSEATELLLDGSSLFINIQGVLSLLPRNAWHVRGLPSKDVPIGAEEGGECVFLCLVEPCADQGGLVGVVLPEEDDLRPIVRLQL
jgi:hypothetical protein